jgi:hypothetical protein
MALAKEIYTGDGTTATFSYGNIDLLPNGEVAHSAQLDVYVDNVLQTFGTGNDYTLNVGSTNVVFESGSEPGSGLSVVIERDTKIDTRYVTFEDNSIIDDTVLNRDSDQLFYLIQELFDDIADALLKNPAGTAWAGEGLPADNFATGTGPNSLVTLSQLTAAVAGVPAAEISNAYVATFSGDSSETEFTLNSPPVGINSAGQLIVTISGVVQASGTDYTYTGGVLTFLTAPPTGTNNIRVVAITGGIVASSIGDRQVTSSMLANDSVTLTKLDFETGDSNRAMLISNNGNPFLTLLNHSHISDFDTGVRQNRLNEMTAPNASVSFGSQKITNLGTPTASSDGATKGYVDGAISTGLAGVSANTKISVNATTTDGSGNLTVSSLAFAPSAIILSAISSATPYTYVFTPTQATWGSFTCTLTSNGFSFSGGDASSAISYTAVKSS